MCVQADIAVLIYSIIQQFADLIFESVPKEAYPLLAIVATDLCNKGVGKVESGHVMLLILEVHRQPHGIAVGHFSGYVKAKAIEVTAEKQVFEDCTFQDWVDASTRWFTLQPVTQESGRQQSSVHISKLIRTKETLFGCQNSTCPLEGCFNARLARQAALPEPIGIIYARYLSHSY